MGGRLVALHGFTQTHHHVHDVALALAHRVGYDSIVMPDLPGHGLSGDDRSGLESAAETLIGLCGRGTYLGYSMGGRFALSAALSAAEGGSDAVERLVLIGATAGLDDAAEASSRRQLDDRRAADVESRGVDAFVQDWLALPMFSGLPANPRGAARRRRNTPSGLAHSLRSAGTGSMPALWARLHHVTAPTLVLAGARDTKFSALGRRLAAAIPDAEFAAVPGAGHAAHVERPAEVVELIASWLDRTPRIHG